MPLWLIREDSAAPPITETRVAPFARFGACRIMRPWRLRKKLVDKRADCERLEQQKNVGARVWHGPPGHWCTMPTSAEWFAQAAQTREKAAELHRLAQKIRTQAASVGGSSAQLTQILDAASWGGDKAIRTHANLQDSVKAVLYVADQANTDADELELRARQLDGDAEQYEAEGKRQAFLEAEAEAEAARQRATAAAQAAATQAAATARAASASQTASSPASSSAAVTSAPPAKPALIFAPIESTPAAPAAEAQPEPATDSYNF
jgi:hypothetical protein